MFEICGYKRVGGNATEDDTNSITQFNLRMEDKNLEMLFNLNEKAKNILQSLSSLSERDIRKVYFNMFSSQVIINYLNYKINVRFSETNRDEFLYFF